jgi:transcriptional repressor of cell division inhibition gene dicB
MLTKDAIDHYGSRAAIAAALNISRAAVGKWAEVVPEGSAYKIESLTDRKLRVDPALYAPAGNSTAVA